MERQVLTSDILNQIFDDQPESVVWFTPLFDVDNSVVDFEVGYCNAAALQILNCSMSAVLGQRLRTTELMDKESRARIFEQCEAVWKGSRSIEFTYYSAGFDKYFNVMRSKVHGGILSVTRDKTGEVRLQLEQEKQTELLNKLVSSSPSGTVLLQAVLNDGGIFNDFKILKCNERFASIFKRTVINTESKNLSDISDAFRYSELWNVLVKTIADRHSYAGDIFLKEYGGWYFLSVERTETDKLVAQLLDINVSKQQAFSAEQKSVEIESILDASLSGFFAMEAVRDEEGTIIDLRIIRINKAFKDILKLGKETEGKLYSETFPTAHQSQIFLDHCKAINDHCSVYREVPYTLHGKQRSFAVSLTPWGNNGVLQSFTDITEQVELKKQLEDLSNKLHRVVNGANAGLCLMHPVYENGTIVDFTIALTNNSMARIFGRPAEELTGQILSDLYPSYKQTEIFDHYTNTYRTGETKSFELNYTRDGYNVWMQITCSKLHDELMVTYFNFTKLKSLQSELEDSLLHQHELEQLNEFKDEFLNIASHELKTPLTTLKAYLQLVLRDRSLVDTTIPKAWAQTTKLEKLISDLLDSSKINRDGLSYTFEEVDINQLLEECAENLRQNYSGRSIVIISDEALFVQADKMRLEQAFSNIIENGLKYSEEEVTVIISSDTERLHVRVIDRGKGIAKDEQSKLFDRFYRSENTRHKSQGLGLGLFIAKRIITDHQGQISLESVVGEGTEFIVYLPIRN